MRPRMTGAQIGDFRRRAANAQRPDRRTPTPAEREWVRLQAEPQPLRPDLHAYAVLVALELARQDDGPLHQVEPQWQPADNTAATQGDWDRILWAIDRPALIAAWEEGQREARRRQPSCYCPTCGQGHIKAPPAYEGPPIGPLTEATSDLPEPTQQARDEWADRIFCLPTLRRYCQCDPCRQANRLFDYREPAWHRMEA